MKTQYEQFVKLTDELYSKCTTEQKLGVYISHHPAAVVPFLLELILELHPEPQDPTDDTAGQD
jgi:hypothetical protein